MRLFRAAGDCLLNGGRARSRPPAGAGAHLAAAVLVYWGDAVLWIPALRAARRLFPTARLEAVVSTYQ